MYIIEYISIQYTYILLISTKIINVYEKAEKAIYYKIPTYSLLNLYNYTSDIKKKFVIYFLTLSLIIIQNQLM